MGFHPGRASQGRGRGGDAPAEIRCWWWRRGRAPGEAGERAGFFAFWIVLRKGNVWRKGQRRSAGASAMIGHGGGRTAGGGSDLGSRLRTAACFGLRPRPQANGRRSRAGRQPACESSNSRGSTVMFGEAAPRLPTGGATAGRAGTTHPPPPGSPARWPGRR